MVWQGKNEKARCTTKELPIRCGVFDRRTTADDLATADLEARTIAPALDGPWSPRPLLALAENDGKP